MKAVNDKEFTQFFNTYFDKVQYFTCKMLRQNTSGQDIAQDSFTKAWLQWNDFKSLENAKAFVFLVSRRACLDLIKKEKRLTERHKEVAYLEQMTERHIEQLIIEAELLEEIKKDIESLSDQCRAVIKLWSFEGLSHQQIADRLGISLDSVKAQKSLGLKKIRYVFLDRGGITVVLLFYLLTDN